MTMNVVLYGAADGAAMEYNSTQGGLVVNGRLQVIQVPKLQSLTVQLNVPNIYGVDGMASWQQGRRDGTRGQGGEEVMGAGTPEACPPLPFYGVSLVAVRHRF